MAIRLAALFATREVDLGYGVTVTLKPLGFADLKAAEAASLRGARERLLALRDASDQVADPDARSLDAELAGLAEEMMLDELVARHASNWTGVVDEDGVTPVELNRDTWRRFRQGVPFLADKLRLEFRMPLNMVVAEGNPSAP